MTELELKILRLEMRATLSETLLTKLIFLSLSNKNLSYQVSLALAKEALEESAKHIRSLYATGMGNEFLSTLYADEFQEVTERFGRHIDELFACLKSS